MNFKKSKSKKRINPFWKRPFIRKKVKSEKIQAKIDELKRKMKENADNIGNVLLIGTPSEQKKILKKLGSQLHLSIYQIDLAYVINKYKDEAEIALENLLSKAEHKDWVLFFDEADSLFGERTDVSDAHDRYENVETNALVQRIEEFDGLALLASNKKKKLSEKVLKKLNIKTVMETSEKSNEDTNEK
ncbi:MAG: hypothetical protein BAJALOKI3v1_890017 [Promethearchaeota archaeon]|jgi:SpoVK/Ycf46/Vps4 family AAA+-type ATPase|nr:MAG: hypothetical protein BAJALOKI3v1_890017 [Candidatus Lokiarchaeota archaeon]